MAPETLDDVFALPDGAWTHVSPRLATLRRTTLVVVVAVITVVLGIVLGATLGATTAAVAAAVGLAVLAWGWAVLGRNARSWAYAERAEDLLVVHGVMFRRLVVVPYGRMQLVDVQVDPLARLFGLARVQLHTAAATTDAHIPGLEPAEAARLRDRLTALGEARSAGL